MTTYNVTADDWKKLYKWSGDFAEEIRQKLPPDFELEYSEIKSYVFDAYLNLAKSYKEGDLSFTSYCFKYAKTHTFIHYMLHYMFLRPDKIRTYRENNIYTRHYYDN